MSLNGTPALADEKRNLNFDYSTYNNSEKEQ